ncbi:hypothetical protein [uncultured Victivallis sp.]|uniref:hypothetical protein n=1 Tax=uncultured Victivallis sp. TaxID=354118 RepID=UPI00258E0B08|nr:hypothetical protein [uncultured Victivallis sp.]
MSIEAEIVRIFIDRLNDLLPGFPVYELKSNTVEKQDRFAAVETGLLKQEGPGIPLYQLPFAIHLGTRKKGDGGDPDESDLDEAYEAVRAAYAVRTRLKIADGWFLAGMVPTEPERTEDDTHNTRVLQYTLFIINQKEN